MPKNVSNSFSPSDYQVWTAPQSAALPTQLPTSTSQPNMPSGWYDVGYLSDAGITESHTYNENKVYDMAGALLRVIRNQEERTFTFECVENDAVTHGLMYGTTATTTGGTAEVQTVTITGSPTGGTFTVNLPGYGAYTATNSVTTSALQTALQNLWDMAVTVTGTAGTSYIITFPAGEGNPPQVTVSSALTGGTTPAVSVATTTPGVQGVNTRYVGRNVARNLRYFAIDLYDGPITQRFLITQGEALWTGSVPYNASSLKIAQFTLNAYLDPSVGPNGAFYTDINNNPADTLSYA